MTDPQRCDLCGRLSDWQVMPVPNHGEKFWIVCGRYHLSMAVTALIKDAGRVEITAVGPSDE